MLSYSTVVLLGCTKYFQQFATKFVFNRISTDWLPDWYLTRQPLKLQIRFTAILLWRMHMFCVSMCVFYVCMCMCVCVCVCALCVCVRRARDNIFLSIYIYSIYLYLSVYLSTCIIKLNFLWGGLFDHEEFIGIAQLKNNSSTRIAGG